MILAGDIGGTNTRLTLVPLGGRPQSAIRSERFKSRDHASLQELVLRFLGRDRPRAAVFGVAGPVLEGTATGTNLDWTIDRSALQRLLGIGAVEVLNDLEATGYGLRWLDPARFLVLNEGLERKGGNACLIAAGTGLGEAILARTPAGAFRPLPSEGGHCEFAPRDALQDGLLQHLRAKFGTVSWERVVSGPGIVNVFDYLAGLPGNEPGPELERELAAGDRAAVITRVALAGCAGVCGKTLELCIALYGAAAANLALKSLATGGVFVGGGIAPKILPALAAGGFMAAFRRHSVLGSVLSDLPVRVVLEEDTALIGAAGLALELAG